MSPKRLRNTIEIIGSLAVMLGLIFVGLELRQNTAAVQSAILQSTTDGSQEYLLQLASDPSLTEILIRATEDYESLSAVERHRLLYTQRAQWLRIQNAFVQWRAGTLSDAGWSIYEQICVPDGSDSQGNWIGDTLRSQTFDDHRVMLLDEFVNYLQACGAVGAAADK